MLPYLPRLPSSPITKWQCRVTNRLNRILPTKTSQLRRILDDVETGLELLLDVILIQGFGDEHLLVVEVLGANGACVRLASA